MSIAGAFSNALSGLTASSRAAELVSSNVANAMTEGYGARSLELSSRTLGGSGSGVRIDGVRRQVDEVLIGDRRLADAAIGYHGAQEQFLEGLMQVIGTPDQPGSLSGHMAQFEAALIEAAARPESDARLSAVLNAAENLTGHLKGTSDHIQKVRLDADHAIARQVAALNAGLEDVRSINVKIQEARSRGVDPSGLMDLRQMKIDELSPIVPLKQLPRENGMIALITTGGTLLLDGKPAQLGFTSVNTVVPEMTLAGGALSGLTINGLPVDVGGGRSLIAGGSLAGQFEVRDSVAVTAQQRIDGFARDLVERFQDPALDPTRAPGGPGMFTDGGAAFVATDEIALSSRLAINAAVDPVQGGALWRLRDGLGAASQGNVGNASLLNKLADALGAARVPVSGGFSGVARASAGLASDLLSLVSSDKLQSETRLGFATAQHQTLRQMELSKGVDTDAEMQKLMQIEQAYAANARVISTADEMIQTILAI
ncbi:flagellar hook-associated protein FlgK [Aliiroseovarius sp. S1339]|uniref:flagellar hook-associated protein FlgK n=1 Tax=Aliiroseovarius sp. S1339 TaxID=2936990 RepID=UPI002076BD5C|nr:flagellar hook-associated protein FlgK [Aliiroseovarius sp. S1339]MCK8464094.1 flagellar hook-associated protein FlgK [Aliiroseovarius sp. S1339]